MTELETVARFLATESTLSLATTDPDGTPAVAPLFYLAAPDLRLYWFSSASSRHTRNLRRDPAAAVTIYRHTDSWREIQGVQMRGRAVRVASRTERGEVMAQYTERFRLGTMFELAMAGSRLYRFEPAWLRYIDNAKRFGYKFELTLPEPRA